jgi:hypothetical protein
MHNIEFFPPGINQPTDASWQRRAAQISVPESCECDCDATQDFIAEMRQRLTLLSIQVNTRQPELNDQFKAVSRRIAYLESALPELHAQGSRLERVEREVALLTDILAVVVSETARQKASLWNQVKTTLLHFLAKIDPKTNPLVEAEESWIV